MSKDLAETVIKLTDNVIKCGDLSNVRLLEENTVFQIKPYLFLILSFRASLVHTQPSSSLSPILAKYVAPQFTAPCSCIHYDRSLICYCPSNVAQNFNLPPTGAHLAIDYVNFGPVVSLLYHPSLNLIGLCIPEQNLYEGASLLQAELHRDYVARMHDWYSTALNLATTAKPNYLVSAWPIRLLPGTNFVLRTGFYLNSGTVIFALGSTTGTEIRNMVVQNVMEFLKRDCRGPFGSLCSCTLTSNKRYIRCNVSERSGTSSAEEKFRPTISFAEKGLHLDIEPVPTNEGGLHVCLQGVLYSEEILGAMTDDFFQTFIAHYASIGATNIHLYTNSFYSNIDAITRIKSPKATKVWIHDTGLGPLKVSRTTLGVQRKFQSFAISDCVARTKAMGAAWTAIVDLDEFVTTDPNEVPGQLPLVTVLDRYYSASTILWLPSYMFNTAICSPFSGRNDYSETFAHFVFAQPDLKTYMGRRKALVNMQHFDANWIGDVLFSTHSVTTTGLSLISQTSQVTNMRGGYKFDRMRPDLPLVQLIMQAFVLGVWHSILIVASDTSAILAKVLIEYSVEEMDALEEFLCLPEMKTLFLWFVDGCEERKSSADIIASIPSQCKGWARMIFASHVLRCLALHVFRRDSCSEVLPTWVFRSSIVEAYDKSKPWIDIASQTVM